MRPLPLWWLAIAHAWMERVWIALRRRPIVSATVALVLLAVELAAMAATGVLR